MDSPFENVGLSAFFGGWSSDKQLGTAAQFYYSKHLDFRKSPSSFSVLPKPVDTDGGVVVDLVEDITQVGSGIRYAVGDAGYVYKITTGGVWSVLSTLGENGGGGIAYRSDVDHIYIPAVNKVARIKRIQDSGTFEQNWFKSGKSTASTCYKTGGVAIFNTFTSLTETATRMRTFTSDIEPVIKIGVKIMEAGTGDWTLTLHDDVNNSLGTATITNANVSEGNINYFEFSAPIRIQRGNSGAGSALTYHFHVTSSVADGQIATTTAGSLADCDMELWANALVSTENGLHPIGNFSNLTLIGNGRYVAAYEPLQDSPTTADFNRHRLTLPPGFEVCGFAQKNLMCVIGAEKRSTSGEFQEGALFFWDLTAETYNDWWLVPEGSPEGLFSHKNVVYFIAGGALYRMRGGDEPIKVRTFRNTDSEYSNISDITHVNPNVMTVRRGVLLTGYPTSTTNRSLEHGVYSLGAITREYPESFGFSYTTSNDSILNTGSNNLRIGMVKSYGDTLYISWRDDLQAPQTYGVDIVNNSSTPNTTGVLETLNFDDKRPYSYKNAGYLIATFEALPADIIIKLKYKIDREANWNYSEEFATDGATSFTMPIDKRFLNIEFGIDIAISGTSIFTGLGLYLFFDPLKQERPIGN